MAVFAVRMMGMLMMMKELRRWRYLARHRNTGAVLQVLAILLRLRVHLALLARRRRRLALVADVVNVDLPAQVTMREALEKERYGVREFSRARSERSARASSDYLIVHRVGGVLVGHPFHDAGLAVVALEGQDALISPEGRELVRVRLVLIGHPVAEATHARGDGLAALPAHAGKYLHFLSGSESEQPLRSRHVSAGSSYARRARSLAFLPREQRLRRAASFNDVCFTAELS